VKSSTYDLLNIEFDQMPILKGSSVSLDEVRIAEKELGVAFCNDYIEFVMKYGGAIVGPYPLYGLRRCEAMARNFWSLIEVTKRFRSKQWPELGMHYVVSDDHAGNPIWIESDGTLKTFDHDAGDLFLVADNLESYILDCLKK
jgi:SMI1-KNR4 cell-wall